MRPERRYRMAGTVLAGLLMAFSVETEVRAEEASTIEMLQQPEMPIGNVSIPIGGRGPRGSLYWRSHDEHSH
jgi:hypothetical protein